MAKKKKSKWFNMFSDEEDYYSSSSDSGSSYSSSYPSFYGGGYGKGGYSGYGFSRFTRNDDQKKEDVVQPEISSWIEGDLMKGIDSIFNGSKKDVPGMGSRKHYNQHVKELQANKTGGGIQLQDHMMRDIFKMYYNDEDEIKFDIKTDKLWWHHMLSETDNYMMKIISRNSFSNSLIITQSIAENLVRWSYKNPEEAKKMMEQMQALNEALQQEQENQQQEDANGGQGEGEEGGEQGEEQGEGDGNGEKEGKDGKEGKGKSTGKGPGTGSGDKRDKWDRPTIEKAKANSLNQKFKEIIKKGIEQAKDDIKKKDDILSLLGAEDSDVKDLDQLNDYMEIKEQIGNVKLNKKDIERFIKTSIKNLKTSLAGKATKYTEELIDADEFFDIPDPECIAIHALLEDAEVFAERFSMKFDAYVDCSGSMSSGLGGSDQLSRMALAKILLYKMCNMNLIGDIYRFEGSVDKRKINKQSIFRLSAGGGTCIDSVVRYVEKTQRPSLVISDGDDCVSGHNPLCYMLCLASPVQFSGSSKKSGRRTGAQYVDRKQVTLYKAGKFFPFHVDKEGRAAFRNGGSVQAVER